MKEPVISLRGVCKSYMINTDGVISKGLFQKKKMGRYVVFDDVNLDVYEGDIVGIIGRNGTGKSTLLKIISGVLDPDCGDVEVNGRIASILELSMGFHNDLTGRENILLRSELYGIPRKQVYEYLDDVVEYSDLGMFIDNPVRTYSSGMRSRLAFSVMTHVEADIFLIDEALSTGDAAFSQKATEHLGKLVREGKTVLITSHNINTLKSTCNRAIWLKDRTLAMDGPAKEVCKAYTEEIEDSFEDIVKLAKGGSSIAQYRMAGFYRHGINVEADKDEYVRWLKQASDRGNNAAMFEYAEHLMTVDPHGNLEEAKELYRRSAESGGFEARKRYAFLCCGYEDEAAFLRGMLGKLAESGYPTDVCAYANIISNTAISTDDKVQAFELYTKAAEGGNTEAMFRKGKMLLVGSGVRKSETEAIECFTKAAEQGYVKAMTTLAEMYDEGRYIEKDPEKAYHWFLMSAESGVGQSQYMVATKLSEGDGVEKDLDLANLWYRRFLDNSHNTVRLQALDSLRRRHLIDNDGVDRILRCASESGNQWASTKIANNMLKNAKGTDDERAALEMYERASKGSAKNRANLARALLTDNPEIRDEARAFEMLVAAAASGSSDAMYDLACMYRDGTYVPLDRDNYKKYVYMAADTGNREAARIVTKWESKKRRRAMREEESIEQGSDTEGT